MQIHLQTSHERSCHVAAQARRSELFQIVLGVDLCLRFDEESPHAVDMPKSLQASLESWINLVLSAVHGQIGAQGADELEAAVGVISVEGVVDVPEIVSTNGHRFHAVVFPSFNLCCLSPETHTRGGVKPFADTHEGRGTDISEGVASSRRSARQRPADASLQEEMVVGRFLFEVVVAGQLRAGVAALHEGEARHDAARCIEFLHDRAVGGIAFLIGIHAWLDEEVNAMCQMEIGLKPCAETWTQLASVAACAGIDRCVGHSVDPESAVGVVAAKRVVHVPKIAHRSVERLHVLMAFLLVGGSQSTEAHSRIGGEPFADVATDTCAGIFRLRTAALKQ